MTDLEFGRIGDRSLFELVQCVILVRRKCVGVAPGCPILRGVAFPCGCTLLEGVTLVSHDLCACLPVDVVVNGSSIFRSSSIL